MFYKVREVWRNLVARQDTAAAEPQLTEAETAALFAVLPLVGRVVVFLAEHGPALQSLAKTVLDMDLFEIGTGDNQPSPSNPNPSPRLGHCMGCGSQITLGLHCESCKALLKETFPNGVKRYECCPGCFGIGHKSSVCNGPPEAGFLSPHSGLCSKCTETERVMRKIRNEDTFSVPCSGGPCGPADAA